MLLDLLAPFVIGFVGSLHCLGMCGPLVLAYSLHLRKSTNQVDERWISSFQTSMIHHVSFHTGRILSYGFLGALAAGLFYVADLSSLFLHLRGGLTLLGGVLMVVLGFVLLRVFPFPGILTIPSPGQHSFWRRHLDRLFRSHRLGSKLVLGLCAGFLPCGLSWAMIVKAATTQNIPAGCLTMICFGLGTMPALLAAGFSASFLSLNVRILGEKVAAISVIIMGLILLSKGAKILV